ncbi:hypothetical protein ENSA5_22710 [Enhygromyxa salina]|uniref:Glycosyl transferases group 1 n=1 Tax=Enhygromyxa salina TaxID=215803 RepID=A0A2S9YBH5_9BACT|nr:hypothetical protein [Enhygromyxa salina]PRQ02453.1 hypothetical protein ENSA5_22710 [Enhygromyxa salina]
MKLLLVNTPDLHARSVATIHRYVAVGRALGHEVVIFGDPNPELPSLPFTTDLRGVDLALFVVEVAWDFPDMPALACLLDGVPRERRVVVDLWSRYGDTIRTEHDFNHLEKLDGHQGWEWVEAFEAVSDMILQPTLAPLRPDVRPFLFHGFDEGAVARPHASAREAASAWRRAGPDTKRYGMIYVGNNWQRWGQLRSFVSHYGPVRDRVGPACLIGWDWDQRPDWAADNGIVGVDVDPSLLAQLGVETRTQVRFDEVIGLLGQARFTPVVHRPLFRKLGFVTNRTFETFCADTLPVLMLPRDFVEAVYGPAALALVPGEDLAAHLEGALRRPEPYWEAVLRTRSHLAREHSFERRFDQLAAIFDRATSGQGRARP